MLRDEEWKKGVTLLAIGVRRRKWLIRQKANNTLKIKRAVQRLRESGIAMEDGGEGWVLQGELRQEMSLQNAITGQTNTMNRDQIAEE